MTPSVPVGVVDWKERFETSVRNATLEFSSRSARSRSQKAALAGLSALDFTDLDASLRRILSVVAETLEIERISLWFMRDAPIAIDCDRLYERTPERWTSGARLLESDYPAYFRAMQSGEVIAASDAHRDPRTAEFRDGYLAPNGICSMLDIPVWEEGALAGVVCCEHVCTTPRDWFPDEQDFVVAIGNVVSRVLATRHRRNIEARLLVADRMATMGVLAAGVAHEINNPLAYVLGNIGFLSETLQRARRGEKEIDSAMIDELLAAVADAIEGTHRVRDIVTDLRTFSRDGEQRSLVDLNKSVRSAHRMSNGEIRQRATVDLDLGEVPRLQASESRLGQLVLNLMVNAAQAMPARPVGESRIRVTTHVTAGEVVLEVTDNGAGVPPDIQHRIFDPFFTTKAIGQGTGLGLSICHTIVTSFGGTIRVDSAPGRGTTFRVTFPIPPS